MTSTFDYPPPFLARQKNTLVNSCQFADPLPPERLTLTADGPLTFKE